MRISATSSRAMLLAATMLYLPGQAFAQTATGSTASDASATTQATDVTQREAPHRSNTDLTADGDAQVTPEDRDVVVTGTLVRGIAPPGASPIVIDSRAIRSTGVDSVAQLLETVPQLGSFGTLQQPLAQSPEVSTNRPNLRNLPGFNTAGGSTTLVLVDGHRIVGMGNNSTSPDPDVLPPGIIDRVEIVPDGGSAQYGSDAVAGVINFITMRRFDGVRADGSYGFADHYHRWDTNLTVGRDWGSGSAYLSYNYAQSSALLGRDRDYIRQYPNSNGYTSLNCSPGNIETLAGAYGTAAGKVVGLPAGTQTTPNQCDESDYATTYPSSQRHSGFAGLTQQLSPAITYELRAFYTNRKTQIQNGPLTFTQILVPQPLTAALQARGVPAISSPFETVRFGGFVNGQAAFVPSSANTVDLVEQVDGQYPVLATGNVLLDTFGINQAFTADLGHSLRARIQGDYGQSTAIFTSRAVNQAAQTNAITSGLFNPFDPASSNAAATSIITNFENYNRARQRQFDLKGTIDGDLFALPGGTVKFAIGAELEQDRYISDNGQEVPGYELSGAPAQSVNGTLIAPAVAAPLRFDVARTIKSAFGEIVAPLIDRPSGLSLTVSAAGRYDSYTDVGDTFNPRFGATFKPVKWISIRGAWGKSFNAPSLADAQNAQLSTLFVLSGASAAFFAPPAALSGAGQRYPTYNGGLIVALRGNAPGIQPQKATTWSAGFDVQPPFIPGLNIGATYFNIRFNNFIGLAPFQTPALLYANYPSLVTVSPSQSLINSAISTANVINGPTPVTASTVYAFLDARKTNLGDVKLDGIDMRLNYQTKTSFGSAFANVNGTYELDQAQSATNGGAFVDQLSNNASRLRIRSSAGGEVGPLLGEVTWNHVSGYTLSPAVGYVPQTSYGAFNTFDLYFRLKLPGLGPTHDTAITLNVDNVLDKAPPVYRGGSTVPGQDGILNNNTIGRFFRFGLTTRF